MNVRLFWLMFLLMMGLSSQLFADNPLPASCKAGCEAPYGQVLGQSPSGVKAYSNCNSACVVFNPANHDGTYTGIQWQCVEYARRWLLINQGVVYGDVDYAIDIWDKIDHYRHVERDEPVAVSNYVNGSAEIPQRGDLLIYAKVMFGGTGHVAVITSVSEADGYVTVAEQNFSNKPWVADYARKIPLVSRGDTYWLLDGYLIGWKRMQAGSS